MGSIDNLIGRVPLLPRYVLAALLLCGLIFAIVFQRAEILRNGQEVRLEVVPVDPRDLFRGDYVVLDYRIASVDLPKDATDAFRRGQKVFVTLRPDEKGKARAVAISSERPAVSGADIVILGTVTAPSACSFNEAGIRDCKSRKPGGPREIRARKLFRAAGRGQENRDDRKGPAGNCCRRRAFRPGGDQAPLDRRSARL